MPRTIGGTLQRGVSSSSKPSTCGWIRSTAGRVFDAAVCPQDQEGVHVKTLLKTHQSRKLLAR